MRRRASELAILLVLAAAPLAAQVRESIEVRVLELEATVLDRAGKPVEGLTRDDFQVRIGNRAAPITNFFAVRDGSVVVDDADGLKPVVTPTTSIPTSLVIFIDDLHLSPGSRKHALDALKRYVSANLGPNTTATLIRYNRHFDVRLRPTERPGPVINELDKLALEPPAFHDAMREEQRMIELIDAVLFGDGKGGRGAADVAGESPDTIFVRIEDFAEKRSTDVDRTINALEDAIELASAFTGRRALLYVSDGLPQQPAFELFEYWERASRNAPQNVWRQETGRMDLSKAMRFDRSDAFRRLVQSAQRANVAIYSFDAGGLRGYEGRGVESFATKERLNTMVMQSNQRGGLQYVADESGGMYIANDNNVDRVLARMSEQFSSYYSIGVQPRTGDIVIKVKNRPDLRVVASRRRPPRTREDELQQSVRQRLYTRNGDNPLGASVQLGTAARVNGQCVVPLRLDVPRSKVAPELTPNTVEVRMVMLNEHNDETPLQRLTVPFESGRVAHSMMLRVRPERHVLSLSVSNPMSGEASYLQSEIDATTCH